MMDELGRGDGGTRRVLAATVGVATSTAMRDAGQLSDEQYIGAVMVGNGINSGAVPVLVGLQLLMGLWMGADGLGSPAN